MKVLSVIDRWLVGAAVRTEWVGRRYSHRLAQGLRGSVAVAHEALWLAASRMGLTEPDLMLMHSVLAVPVKDVPRFPPPVGARVSPLASTLVKGQYSFHVGSAVPIEQLSWLTPPASLLKTPLDRLHFHSLGAIQHLVEAHGISRQAEYLDAARRLTLRWVAECLFTERAPSIWSDHTTALRTLALTQLWLACRAEETADSPFARTLVGALIRHAMRLAHPAFYRAEHNHGVTQAFALLTCGVVLAPHLDAASWRQQGCERLEAQVSDNVSSEGVHREHSPAYQQYVLLQLLATHRFARAHGVTLSSGFESRLGAMVQAATHMLKPDGHLSALGDGSAGSPVLVRPEDLLDLPREITAPYTYAATRGTAGRPPAALDAVFPGGGIVFLRSGWGTERAFDEESFLSFRLETFPTSHVHRDLLSFELQAFGTDLVVDSGGPGIYPLRAWLKSTSAHNTVVVDGRNQSVGRAHLRASRLEPGWALLDAEHAAYAGVRHRRILIFRRSGPLLVIDRLVSDTRRRYSLLFHLAPDLIAFQEDLGVRTRSERNGPTLQILPLATTDLALEIHQGCQPASRGRLQASPDGTLSNFTLEYRREGAEVTFATLLLPARQDLVSAATATLSGRLLEGDFEISVASPEDSWVLGLNAQGGVTRHGSSVEVRS